jgi:hypothetical protein
MIIIGVASLGVGTMHSSPTIKVYYYLVASASYIKLAVLVWKAEK